MLISSAGQAELYDAETGERLWKMEDLSGNTIPSPTVAGAMCYWPRRCRSLRQRRTPQDQISVYNGMRRTDFRVKWRAERALCDYASPVVCLQYVYYVNRTGVVYCLDWRLAKNCIRIA